MGVSVMILGVSGTGKSFSMKNFGSDEIALVTVEKTQLPFKGKFNEVLLSDSYKEIEKFIKGTKKKSIVVDDAQYLMGNEFMRRVTEKGYDKFSEMAQNFYNLLMTIRDLPEDKIVYLLGHIERDSDGNEKFKTMGKLIDQCINVEGTTIMVLKTAVTDGNFFFLTQNSGRDTVKSPFGMFPTYAIENDLKYVDDKIRNYYELGDYKPDAEIAEADKTAGRSDVVKDEVEGKKRRSARGKADADKSEPAATTDPTPEPDKPRGRSRKTSDSLDAERAKVTEENMSTLAQAGLDNSDSEDGVPFDTVVEPELKEPPRRKKRGEQEAPAPTQEPEPVESARPRRVRR